MGVRENVAMTIKVKRKAGVEKINFFSCGAFPSLEFPNDQDVFEIPIIFLSELSQYFEPYFPVKDEEKKISEALLGGKK